MLDVITWILISVFAVLYFGLSFGASIRDYFNRNKYLLLLLFYIIAPFIAYFYSNESIVLILAMFCVTLRNVIIVFLRDVNRVIVLSQTLYNIVLIAIAFII